MIYNIFLKDSINNKEIIGDYVFDLTEFKYINETNNVLKLDKIIMKVYVKRKQSHDTFFGAKLANGFNFYINDKNIFPENIKDMTDIYSYDISVNNKKFFVGEIYQIVFNVDNLSINNGDIFKMIVNDDFSIFENLTVSLKIKNN